MKSMRNHPEQVLFLIPILPFEPWLYDRVVGKLKRNCLIIL